MKSKASKVQPSQAADQASHWSLVGSFHHGMGFAISLSTAAMTPSRIEADHADGILRAVGYVEKLSGRIKRQRVGRCAEQVARPGAADAAQRQVRADAPLGR